MIYSDVKRTTIFLGDADREAIRIIRERFGVSTDSDAIRLAVRVLSEAQELTVYPLPPTTGQEKQQPPAPSSST